MKKKENDFFQIILPATQLVLALILVGLLSGCQPAAECGGWTFNGGPLVSGEGSNNYPVQVAFDYGPASCGQNCQCTTVAMIQIIRVYNTVDQTFEFPGSQEAQLANRVTSYGWGVDQVDGWAYGYYGLKNDGVTFQSCLSSPGSNNSTAVLGDDPGGWPKNTWFYAVDVAVCYKSETCSNRILGYYFWAWGLDSNYNAYTLGNSLGWEGLEGEFQSAVASWNTWAPTQGSQTEYVFPQCPMTTTTVPHVVPFPTLTDL